MTQNTSQESKSLFARSVGKIKGLLKAEKKPADESLTPEERLAARLEVWFDPAVYFLVLIIGIPLFLSPGGESRTLPLFTGVVSLAWLFSKRAITPSYQKVLHPILVTSFITVFVVWAFGAMKGLTLTQGNFYTSLTDICLFLS
jgi:hypothetical protein